MTKTAAFIATLVLLEGCSGVTQPRGSRLNCGVALVYEGAPIGRFVAQPGRSHVQAYVRFDSALPDDVVFGIDQEHLDGVACPFHFTGRNWMSLIGVQRSGAMWITRGADEVFVIGGAELYAQSFPFADRLQLTEIARNFDGDA